jgi:hypothetical protein
MNTPRISWAWTIILVTMAATFDIGQGLAEFITGGLSNAIDLLVIDPLITALFWFIFYFFCKVNFTRTRAFVYFGIALLEFVPYVGILPLWTFDIIAVIMMIRAEDKLPFLKKLDQSTQTNKFGFGSKVTNASQLRTMMNPRELRAMKRVSGVIMRKAGLASNVIPTITDKAAERKQNFDKQVRQANEMPVPMSGTREQKIAAQKGKKTA